MIEFTEVVISNPNSLGGLILDTADFLRDSAENNVVFEVYSTKDLHNSDRQFRLREVGKDESV